MQHAAPVLVRRGRRRAWMGSIKPVLGPGRALDKRQWLGYLSVLVVALLASACERPTSPMTTQTGRLQVSADVSGTLLSTLVIDVTAADIAQPLVYNLEAVNGVASSTIDVPVGPSRLLTVHGYDAKGIETHRGSRTIDVQAGANNPPTTIYLGALGGDVPITVQIGNYRIVVSPASLTIPVGGNATVTATVVDPGGNIISPAPGKLQWATNRPAVAQVSQAGLVTALAPGSVTIAATYNGTMATVAVTVEDASAFATVIHGVRPRGFAAVSYSLLSPAAGGRTWYVAPTGDDAASADATAPLRTINRAAQLAQAGDVVTIGAGTYNESVLVKNSGTPDRPIVFQSADRGSVVLTGGQYTFQPVHWTGGPEVWGQWYIVVRGLVFRRYSDPLSTENAIAAVRASKGWVVEDDLFDEAGRTGLEIRDSDVLVRRSTFQHNYMNAIIAWGPTDGATSTSDPLYTPITGLRITDVIIWDNNTTSSPLVGDVAEYVVKLWGTKGTVVDNVESYENFGPGFWFDTNNSDFTIRNSYFHNNRPVPGSDDENGKGVFIEVNWAPGLIENNVFLGNNGAGLNLENSQGIEVRNNLFAGNAFCMTVVNGDRGTDPSGQPLYPLKDLFIHDNQCKDWGASGAIAAVWGTFDPTPVTMGIRVDANIYDPLRNTALANWPGIGPLTTLADVQTRLGWEVHGVVSPITLP